MTRRRCYGGRAAARADPVGSLQHRTGWLRVSAEHRGPLERSDHAVDAVVSAFVARAVALGAATVPPPADAAVAAVEGRIALPPTTLDLLPTRGAPP